MSDNIERQRELSRMVLIPGKPKPSEQKAARQIQRTPQQLIYTFSLGAIFGFAVFVTLWIIAGFSKLAVTLPFVGGCIGVAIEMMRQKNKG